MNTREAGRWLRDELKGIGVPDGALEAELLVRWAAGVDRARYFSDVEIECGRLPLVGTALKRRLSREPSAYITGEREFFGRSFEVNRAVLLPRPETEMLVELALREIGDGAGRTVVDVGTGSGCIAVSVAAESPAATVIGVDRSAAALQVAARNSARHASTVEFVQADLLAPLDVRDIVVANLPYIPTAGLPDLEPEVRDWEPRSALDGGPDGLTLIRHLIADCADRLRPRLLALEVGAGQAHAVRRDLDTAGAVVSLHDDLAGIPRVVCGRWP